MKVVEIVIELEDGRLVTCYDNPYGFRVQGEGLLENQVDEVMATKDALFKVIREWEARH